MQLIEISQNVAVYTWTAIYCVGMFSLVWLLFKGNVQF